jgi:RNA polymerase sigma-70 factor (ECF subfamily)
VRQDATTMRDRELCRRAAAGDAGACALVVRQHYRDVYRFLVRLSRDAHRAEDLCQETFAAAWRRIGSYDGRSSLRTWLHRIAYHKWIDGGRRRAAGASDAQPMRREPRDDGPDPLAAAESDEQARLLHERINRLDPAEREAIVLHYLQGLSYREMADVLDEPPGTLKWRTKLALERLRRWTGGEHDEEIDHERRTEPTTARPAAEGPGAAAGPAGA